MIVLEVPASGPLFEGHFPGRPILPGIGLLDLAIRALGDVAGDGALRGIDHFKWRSIVAPGERLSFVAKPPGLGDATSLELRRGAEVVASGAVTLGHPPGRAITGPAGRDAAFADESRTAMTGIVEDPGAVAGLPPLDRLLPHGEPMRLVTAVEADHEDGLACAARVPARSAFVRNGTAPALVAIEMAAQTAAVFEALRRVRAPREDVPRGEHGVGNDRAGGAGPRLGYLVGARGVSFASAAIPAGDTCRVAIRLAGIAGPLSSYRFEVARAGRDVATGALSTWITTTAV